MGETYDEVSGWLLKEFSPSSPCFLPLSSYSFPSSDFVYFLEDCWLAFMSLTGYPLESGSPTHPHGLLLQSVGTCIFKNSGGKWAN